MKQLLSFHQRCASYITRRHINQEADRSLTHPLSQEVLEEADLLRINDYIQNQKITVYKYAWGRPILMEECMASSQVSGPDNHLVWWSQIH